MSPGPRSEPNRRRRTMGSDSIAAVTGASAIDPAEPSSANTPFDDKIPAPLSAARRCSKCTIRYRTLHGAG